MATRAISRFSGNLTKPAAAPQRRIFSADLLQKWHRTLAQDVQIYLSTIHDRLLPTQGATRGLRMQFGFGLRYYDIDVESEDERTLRTMNCDRIYLADRYSQVPLILEEMKLALRKDDIVALCNLVCLGSGLEQILGAIAGLHVIGVRLRVDSLELVPDGPIDRVLGPVCEMLLQAATFCAHRATEHARRRGRPVVLTDRDRARAEHLLVERNASVLEIARLLRVSPATIYRNFPRRRPRRAAE